MWTECTRAAAEAFDKIAPEKRTLLFSRSSYIGMHRYGGIWTGDNNSWWSQILTSMQQMPALNMIGILYTGSDIGGFGSDTTEDLLMRWLEFGMFTPLMRNHAALGTREQDVIDLPDDDFGVWYVDVMDHPERYDGHLVHMKLIMCHSKKYPGIHCPGRFAMVCCENDVQFLGLIAKGDTLDQYENRDWIEVTAKMAVEKHKAYKGKGPVMNVLSIALFFRFRRLPGQRFRVPVLCQILPVVGLKVQNGQGGNGGHAAEARQELADPEAAPVEAVHPQALNHGPAQAVPGNIAQGDLAVIGPLGVQEVQQQKAAQIPQALIQEGGMVVFPLMRHGIVQAHAAEGIRCRAEGFLTQMPSISKVNQLSPPSALVMVTSPQ